MTALGRASGKQCVHLIVRSGPDSGKMYFIQPKREAVIGRGPTADLRLSDGNASGKHCVVRSAGDVAFIQDLKSSNGTRLNGEALTSEQVVDTDAVIEVGTSVIELTWVETESAVPLSSVESLGAPTLLENVQATGKFKRANYEGPGSTLGDAAGLVDFRNAQKQQGKRIGSFMLLEVVGVGGMGFVYRAKNFKSREDVALKLIPLERFRTAEIRDKFKADINKSLQITGTARILMVGEEESYFYIVSDFAKGRSLESLVEAGRKFSAADVAWIGKEIAAILAACHATGAVHGAVTPSSIVLGDDGTVVLLDAGLGRRTDGEGKNILTGDDRLGAMSFRSPEQTRETPPLDAKTDVYSLAATLYFLLTEHRPFTADSRLELARRIRWDEAKAISSYRSDVPEVLAKTISRAMEKEAEKRFASAAEMAEQFAI